MRIWNNKINIHKAFDAAVKNGPAAGAKELSLALGSIESDDEMLKSNVSMIIGECAKVLTMDDFNHALDMTYDLGDSCGICIISEKEIWNDGPSSGTETEGD